MKYILLAGDNYYPEGGWSDYQGCGSVEEMKNLFDKGWRFSGGQFDWGHIVNLENLEEVLYWHNREKAWK